MNPSPQGPAAFEGTRWTVVLTARDKASPDAEKALSELCSVYWYPLYAFVRRSGLNHHEAEDMTQAFFQHLLDKEGLANVAPEKGKFRSFLLTSIKHFLSNQRDKAEAAKRGGGVTPLSLDMASAEGRYEWEPADSDTPDALYERSWAMTLLGDTLADLRAKYEQKQKSGQFDALERFISGSSSVSSYADVAQTLQTSEGNVKVLVHRLRRRFGEGLRERIAHTVKTEPEIDEEIRHLMSLFSN